MKNFILIFVLFISFISCTDNSISPKINPQPIISDYGNFSIIQTNYDTLQIESNSKIKVAKKEISKIILFEGENDNYNKIDSALPEYVEETNFYYLNFKFIEPVLLKKVNLNLRLQYLFNDSTTIAYDSMHSMLSYPYKSAKVFLTIKKMNPGYDQVHFQDITLNDTAFFWHPVGGFGLFEYSFNDETSRYVFDYPGGDSIAEDSNFVFYDDHVVLSRYNLRKDSTDIWFDLSRISFETITGLSCWNHYLYVCFAASPSWLLAKYNYEGHLISIKNIQNRGSNYYLSIYKDKIFMPNFDYKTIDVFDLKSLNYLTSSPLPSFNCTGIKIYKGNFYFGDYEKDLVGYIPFAEMFPKNNF